MQTQASNKTIANKNEQAQVAIIGGGLAGLYSAYLLAQQNISVDVYEAKPGLGGRIMGMPTTSSNYRIDMGPSWIFPHQTYIRKLVEELGLSLKKQFATGDALFQQHPSLPIRQMNGVAPPDMYQIIGGTYCLIEALNQAIQQRQQGACHLQIATNSKLISCQAAVATAQAETETETNKHAAWTLTIEETSGEKTIQSVYQYKQVIFAAPPRIIAPAIKGIFDSVETNFRETFTGFARALDSTPTWMAAQAKFACEFSQATWRERNLSGQAFSQTGPLVEIHDAGHEPSSEKSDSVNALFGFVGLPANQRLGLSEQQIKDACQVQMMKIFDISKTECIRCHYYDWASDEFVATATDQSEASQHPHIDLSKWKQDLDAIGLYFAGSEFSSIDAGYMEGAIVASQRAVDALLTRN